ncbi:MAG: FliM/FliN family flagellar motor C-terminal domain-containing protein [Deltaproteobacteria bacterium]
MQSDSSQADIVPVEFAAVDQGQSDAALAILTGVATVFAKELRRVLPFLARQHARAVPDVARSGGDPQLPALADGPTFLVQLSSAEQVWVALQFDAAAILALVEGLFGTPKPDTGDADDDDAAEAEADGPALGDSLTLAQRALLKRLGGDLAALLKKPVEEACKITLGAPQFKTLKRQEPTGLGEDAIAVDCRLEKVRRPWLLRVWMGAEAVERLTAKAAAASSNSPSFALAALRIPVSVVAELGRVTLKLSQVLGLRVGDTLRLPSPANDPVLVRVEGMAKFDAVPVISRGQVAVKIHSRHQQ